MIRRDAEFDTGVVVSLMGQRRDGLLPFFHRDTLLLVLDQPLVECQSGQRGGSRLLTATSGPGLPRRWPRSCCGFSSIRAAVASGRIRRESSAGGSVYEKKMTSRAAQGHRLCFVRPG